MNLFTLLEYKRSLWEEIKWQVEDLWMTLCDFFIMIKENTVDVLVEKFGDGAVLMIIAVAVIAIMVIALSITNGKD